MSRAPSQRLLEIQAIVVGYAMSRLDRAYLLARRHSSWRDAFERGAAALGVPKAALKNLRDEFDPVHANPRRGWHQRPLRTNRQRVLGALCDVSDEALLELVERILVQDQDATTDALTALTAPEATIYNVAERLRTGRMAEKYFLEHTEQIIEVPSANIEDCRETMCGFDFGIRGKSQVAIEVKGLKQKRGDVQFTDREWKEAKRRQANYWVVVVGNLQARPIAKVIHDPVASLSARCRHQTTVSASWRAVVEVA